MLYILQIIRARRSSLTDMAANDWGYGGNNDYERKEFGAGWGEKAPTQNGNEENCAECDEKTAAV